MCITKTGYVIEARFDCSIFGCHLHHFCTFSDTEVQQLCMLVVVCPNSWYGLLVHFSAVLHVVNSSISAFPFFYQNSPTPFPGRRS